MKESRAVCIALISSFEPGRKGSSGMGVRRGSRAIIQVILHINQSRNHKENGSLCQFLLCQHNNVCSAEMQEKGSIEETGVNYHRYNRMPPATEYHYTSGGYTITDMSKLESN